MRFQRLPLVLLAAIPSFALAKPVPTLHSQDYRRNPAFVPVGPARNWASAPGAVEQYGEVVILEGDSELVSDDGMGGFGIVFDQQTQNPVSITNRFFTKYSDEFDEVILLTTFDDGGAQGALAYEISTQSDVDGLGQQRFDDTGANGWGGDKHKLHAFVNMMRWDQFRDFDGLDVTDPNSGFYTTLGQEFAHRWLSFMAYKDANGQDSLGMLGRDQAHWASTLQADASVMDGDRLVDNGDGSFTNAEAFARYSQLDMYGMGLLPASAVDPWFLVHNAVDSKGRAIDPAQYMRVGNRFKGTREDITIQQVIAANGARAPGADQADHAFRVAFVLVTRPGEKAFDVTETAKSIEVMRKLWEAAFQQFSAEHGTMCTQVSAPCGAATAKLIDGKVVEAGGNHNMVVEPGEPVSIDFTLDNDSPAQAKPVSVKASGQGVDLTTMSQTVAQLDPGQQMEVSFSGQIAKDAPCGVPIVIRGESVVDGHTFRGVAQVVPGITDAERHDFEADSGGFAVNADAKDSTTTNGWQYGTPVEYLGRNGWIFQPGSCNGGSQKCWFTGLQQGHRPMTDSSVGVGKTTLSSAAIDMSKTYKPELRYHTWFQAIDFSNPLIGGLVASGIALTLEGSADGGQSWVQLDRIEGAEPSWLQRDVVLDGKLPLDKTLTLRFTASSPAADQLVEAGIDDLVLITQTQSCNPNAIVAPTMPIDEMPGLGGGCACTVGTGRSSSPLLATLLGLALAVILRRRLTPRSP